MAHIDELFHAVWEHPDDDAMRLVLADALQSEGDPRGDFIHAQFKPLADESLARKLLQQYGLTWLGRLRGFVLPVAYEKGFLASCMVRGPGSGGFAEWSTVHTVELASDDVEVLAHPIMRSLRHVRGEAPGLVDQVLENPVIARTIETLAARRWDLVTTHHAALEQLPQLREFTVSESQRVAYSPLALRRGADARLSRLECRYDPALLVILNSLPDDALIEARVHAVPTSHAADLHVALGRQRRLTVTEVVTMPDLEAE